MEQHQITMTGTIKNPDTAMFTGPTGCVDYIIIIFIVCLTLRWNKKYLANGWIRHDENVWLIEPKDRLY